MLKIKDLDSYDYLFDLDFTGFFAAKKTNSGIPYLLEKLLISIVAYSIFVSFAWHY